MRHTPTCCLVGASGFLGAHARALLHERGYDVICAASRPEHAQAPGWVHVDVTRPDTLRNLPSHVDSVIYLAQSPHYKDFPAQAEHIWEVNVQGVLRMLEYARRARATHFLLASSGSVYAPSTGDIFEDSPLALGPGQTMYAQSKIAAEMLVNTYSPFFSTVCLRFFMPYGPGLSPSMLMARLVRNIVQGIPVVLRGGEGLVFNPVHVEDATRCIVAALSLEGEAYAVNIAGPQAVTLRQVAQTIAQELHVNAIFTHEDGMQQRMVADTKFMSALLEKPSVSAHEGLVKYVRSVYEKNL